MEDFALMIQPINMVRTGFRAGVEQKQKEEYNDPLLNWPIRGAAFTNEVGEAMRPVIGNYANLSWVPALLYFGADIYDKYKNDQTEYSPDSRRALKQAIFQGMASICLPIVAVKAGQNLLSLTGLMSKDKLTINTKEHITKLASDFVANGKMHAYAGKDDECIKEFMEIVSNNMDLSDNKFIKKAYISNKENVHNYAQNTIKSLIELRKNLLNPTEEFKTGEWFSKFQSLKSSGQTENVAVKSVLQKYLKKGSNSGKAVKTLGGFAALAVSINPVDKFVEHILIGKLIAPKLDNKKSAE